MAEVEIIDKPETALIAKANELGVAEEKAVALCKVFQPFIDQAQEWAEQANSLVVTSAEDTKTMKECRSLRLNMKQIRVDVEKTRKAMKEASLREGKAIDGMANIAKFIIVPIEERLQEQEEFAKREQEKKIARLQGERSALLDDYDFDYSYIQLGEMKEDAFQGLLATAKTAHEARIKAEQEAAEAERKRQEEAAKAEAERKAKEAAERKRMEEENARLKVEQEAKEAELQKERAEREKERKALEAKQAAERKKAEAAEKKRKAEAAKKLKAEQEAKAAAEAEAKRLREAEAKRQQEEQARIEAEEAERQKALQADDGAKLDALVLHIQGIELKSEEGQEFLETITGMISDFVDSI